MRLVRIIILLILTAFFISDYQVNAKDMDEVEMDYMVKDGTSKFIVPTTKLTLDALPFNVKIPTSFPFSQETVYRFKTDGIRYFGDNGNIDVGLSLDFRQNQNQRLTMIIGNHPNRDYDSSKIKKINEGLRGYFTDSKKYTTLFFENNDLYYGMDYWNKDVSYEKAKEGLLKMHNSLEEYNKVLTY